MIDLVVDLRLGGDRRFLVFAAVYSAKCSICGDHRRLLRVRLGGERTGAGMYGSGPVLLGRRGHLDAAGAGVVVADALVAAFGARDISVVHQVVLVRGGQGGELGAAGQIRRLVGLSVEGEGAANVGLGDGFLGGDRKCG